MQGKVKVTVTFFLVFLHFCHVRYFLKLWPCSLFRHIIWTVDFMIRMEAVRMKCNVALIAVPVGCSVIITVTTFTGIGAFATVQTLSPLGAITIGSLRKLTKLVDR